MICWRRLLAFVAGAVLVCSALSVAQVDQKMREPGKVIVSIYRVAPGRHLDFLKWEAAREAVDKEAGLTLAQWYVHTNGDSWDFVSVSPERTDAEDKKVEELAKKKGLKTAFAASLEFRSSEVWEWYNDLDRNQRLVLVLDKLKRLAWKQTP